MIRIHPSFVLLLLLISCFAPPLAAQPGSEEDESDQLVADRMLTFGFHTSTRGLGVDTDFRWGIGKAKLATGLDIYAVRHGKETRISSIYQDQGRKFVFDKLNYFTVIAPTFGISYDLFPARSYNKVSVNGTLALGPAIGWVRPYILEIAVPLPGSPGFAFIEEHQYDPALYTFVDIVGQAAPFRGKFMEQIIPGLSIRANSLIRFVSDRSFVSGIQLGLNADIFTQQVPIMAETENRSYFLSASAGFVLGTMWEQKTRDR